MRMEKLIFKLATRLSKMLIVKASCLPQTLFNNSLLIVTHPEFPSFRENYYVRSLKDSTVMKFTLACESGLIG